MASSSTIHIFEITMEITCLNRSCEEEEDHPANSQQTFVKEEYHTEYKALSICHWSLECSTEEIVAVDFIEPNDYQYIVLLSKKQKLQKSRISILRVIEGMLANIPIDHMDNEVSEDANSPPQGNSSNREELVLMKNDSFTNQERKRKYSSDSLRHNRVSHQIQVERIIQFNQVCLTNKGCYSFPRTLITVDSHNIVRMHQIMEFPHQRVPEKFLTHLKMTFTNENLRGESHKEKKMQPTVELLVLEIGSVQLIDQEYLLVLYANRLFFDVLNLNGSLICRKYVRKQQEQYELHLTTLDQVLMNRPQFTVKQKGIISKVIIKGSCYNTHKDQRVSMLQFKDGIGFEEVQAPESQHSIDHFMTPTFEASDAESDKEVIGSYLMVFDCQTNLPRIVKYFEQLITALFEEQNGERMLFIGMNSGQLVVLNSKDHKFICVCDLTVVLSLHPFDSPVKHIQVVGSEKDQTQLLLTSDRAYISGILISKQ